MYVCLCRGITDNQIRKAVQAGKTEFRQLKQSLEVGAQCGKCVRMAMEIIATEIDKMESEQVPLYYEVA
ncbi:MULTISPECIES: bacterioferritin-associated ferredoxin [Aeromonas]|jgi:bacterioferritin-associated ferredoxin|uniref:bacterioferritin-associated ferredoxin n=1 Tax=Aeromonas TaxID=642 RepID=UPI0021C98981|nr:MULTISPECIES: bacterioferritin-associated ferredoxin [Aeromonas]MDM5092765.1 bacterioferritin-associated ferredoxin [Aeromonas rivipollensis]MDM5121489.1 bacterioferritin-associated ferredoxin [Aeromonas rivipollensis]